MLTRLTPRGTSSAAFVKKSRALQLSTYKSLRGRDISVSSEDEEDGENDKEEDKKKSSTASASSGVKKNTPPKRKLKHEARVVKAAIQKTAEDRVRDRRERPKKLPRFT